MNARKEETRISRLEQTDGRVGPGHATVTRQAKGVCSMIAALRTLAASLCVVLMTPLFAANPADFALWTSADLTRRDEALSKKVGADHSARETLADYTSHRFRMLYRDGDGFPEQHDNIVDVVIVKSGESTLLLGGWMVGFQGTRRCGGRRVHRDRHRRRRAPPPRGRRRRAHSTRRAPQLSRREGAARDVTCW